MLPGMDGTGELFNEFLQFYQDDAIVLGLPNQDDQSYVSIAKNISMELPESDFILLAESFSGGLVEHLLQVPHLKGVIFVASFISGPNKALLYLAKYAPKKILTYLPGARFIVKYLFLGAESSQSEYLEFVKVVRSVDNRNLNNRINAMISLNCPNITDVNLPCAYLMPNQDRLITSSKFDEISKIFANSRRYRLDGPHFILQAKPRQAAAAVTLAKHHITRSCSGPD